MPARQSLPLLWLLSDARNDQRLEAAFHDLPEGSGFVFRHYHLGQRERRRRFAELAMKARLIGKHRPILAGTLAEAEHWAADGAYGPPHRLSGDARLLRLATAHDGDQLAAAGRAGADGVFLSPVFPTRSHPEARVLGIHGFHVLAQQSPVAVIALGGMTKARALQLDWPRWGAIDGLASPQDS